MIGTTSRLDNYPFALASELRDAANEHGFRIGPEQASGWIFFRSASAPGEIAMAAVGNDGPFFLSITHSGVARELAAEPAQPCAKGHLVRMGSVACCRLQRRRMQAETLRVALGG